jgi:hypothetical protein
MKGFLKVAYSHMYGFLKSTPSVKGLLAAVRDPFMTALATFGLKKSLETWYLAHAKNCFQELFFPPYRVISGLGDDELVLLEGLQPTFLSRPGHKI